MRTRQPLYTIKPRPRLNKNDLLADTFLTTFAELFRSYADVESRDRLLSGILPDPQHGKLSTRAAIVFVIAIAAAKTWQGSNWRAATYLRARHLSKFNKSPPWYMPADVPQAQRKNRKTERNRIEALVALGFSRSAGYATHSRALWRCIEGAIRTDGLGAPRKVVRSEQDVDDLFELIRARLNYHYAKLGKKAVQDEADKIFNLLSSLLHKCSMASPALYHLIYPHRFKV